MKNCLLVLVVLFSLVQCPVDPPSLRTDVEPLTPEGARKALLEIFDHEEKINWGFLPVLGPELQKEPMSLLGDGEIKIGHWRINLKDRTFHARLLFPNAFRHRHNRWEGVFLMGKDGRWRAKLTMSESGG